MSKTAPRKIIAVDIDDVIFPLVPSLINYLDTEHEVKLTAEDFISYDLRKVWSGGPEEAEIIFEQYKLKADVEVAPLKGAKKALKQLSKRYEVIVMTARDISGKDRTETWILRHFPEIFKDVHILGNKKDSEKWRPKAEVCKELGVYYLVDDNINNVLETASLGINTILFGNYPWNQMESLPENVTRLTNWQEVLRFFDEQG